MRSILSAAEKLFLGKNTGEMAIGFDILAMAVMVLLTLAGGCIGVGQVPGMTEAAYGLGVTALLVAAYTALGGLTLLVRRLAEGTRSAA